MGRSRELGWAGEPVPAGLSPEVALPGSSAVGAVERGWSAGGLVAPLPWSPLLSVPEGCWLGGWLLPASGLPVLFGVFESPVGLV
ncbi:hypothetical protein [Nocardia cyriacigeorgica]|uniref:hypothetical protein n=1 Tax=Nocardia cyriacigeorgica TaxID=135487 RepID=UPI0018934E71|nr:hypothetical protein [Nocardia cyriacigeorgica]MBF6085356.1 hypothetical protein [Nocardia cyriacigeorgica]